VTDSELIESINVAANDLVDANSTVHVEEDHIRTHALKRMGKSLALALAVIKGVGAHIYNQWHPLPIVPVMDDDFDPADEVQLQNYMKRVGDYLNGLVSDLDSATRAADEETGTVYKLGKGIKKVALHIAPFVKLLIKLGKQEGSVIYAGLKETYTLDPRSLWSGLQWVGFIVPSRFLKEILGLTV